MRCCSPKMLQVVVFSFFSSFFIFQSAQAQELTKAVCLSCHENSQPHVSGKTFAESVHGVFECTACHQDITAIPHEPKPASVACSTCHADIAAEHASGAHRVGTGEGFSTNCKDCHGTHNILPKSNPKSPIFHDNIPNTCKKCHLGVFSNFVRSSHGQAWISKSGKSPVCTTCHTAHKIENVASKSFRVHLPDECGKCHEDRAPSYRDSFHGQATSIGYLVAAKCSDCHSAHLNLPKSDPDSTVNPKNLLSTCGRCHPDANANFVQYNPHVDPEHKESSPLLYYITKFMVLLLTFTFSFFGLHTILWFQRIVVALLRKEIHRTPTKGDKWVRRFGREQRITHGLIVVSFLGLAATGIPLKYHYAEWAQAASTFLGGVEVARYFHRLFAVITGCYAVYHLFFLVRKFYIEKHEHHFAFKDSIVPLPHDLTDLFNNLRWFFYLGERPKLGRWTYWEKFDYMAIFWGIPVIGGSGLVLWFPALFTKFLPGIVINLAMIIHGEEALLAMGFIFIFHFFHGHMRPDNFPLDPVIFTGRIPLERFIEERPREYEALVKEGRLEEFLVGPPSPEVMKFARVFGFTALSIGIILIIGIFAAFFS